VKAVWLNFQQPLPSTLRLLRYLLLLCGVIALGFSLYHKTRIDNQATALRWQQQNLTKLTNSRPPRPGNPHAQGMTEDSGKRAEEILRQLDLPWSPLFQALENALKKDVVIMSVTPNPQQQSLTMVALATNVNAAIDFAERLENSTMLADIHMVQEEPDEASDSFPLQFEISAKWNITS